MKKYFAVLALCPLAFADLTTEQKLSDFNQLAALYAKHYAPYEWKRDFGRFDLYNVEPWLARVAASKNDLEFYDIAAEYLGLLNDGHVSMTLPSDFVAYLGFRVDLFDNAPIVYSVDRRMLPVSRFPIAVGDEVVSIDGVSADDLIRRLARYSVAANDRTTARLAADAMTLRIQQSDPTAPGVPDESTVVLRSPDGEIKTLRIEWDKSGLPLSNLGPVPSPKGRAPSASVSQPSILREDDPPFMLPLRTLANKRAPAVLKDRVQGFGSLNPVHRMPENFRQRLGRLPSDHFFSGSFEAEGQRIGFIRIPSFAPSNVVAAANQFAGEIQFFQDSTDGLIIDVSRNPGGDGCYTEFLLSLLIPVRFRSLTEEVRASNTIVFAFSQALEQARRQGAPPAILDLYTNLLEAVRKANATSRGMTERIPVCQITGDVEPARDRQGRSIAFNKPAMVLVDDMSASAADMFAAVFQDSWRGPLFGWRTMGLGGAVVDFNLALPYSELDTRITLTLVHRPNRQSITGYPDTDVIENVGVHPDIPYDSQTRDNLLNGYAPYVEAFTHAMVNHIRASQ